MEKLIIAKKHALHGVTRGRSVDDDLSPAFTIWHTGAPSMSGYTATPVTAATVHFDTGDDLVFTINGAADTRLGTAGKIDCSTETGTYDSILELYNKINAVPGWCMRPEAGIGADLVDNTTRNVLTTSSADCFQKPVTFYWDTSAAEMASAVISNRRIITMGSEERYHPAKISMMEDEGGATNVLEYLKINFNVAGTTPVLTLTIYSCNGETRTDTLLHSQILPDASAETYDFTKCGGLSALKGERLVVRAVCTAASGADIGVLTTFMAQGRSIGGRWVA